MDKSIKSIAVFCASALGTNPIYHEAAYAVGQFLGKRKIDLIYGGSKNGLMGAVADGALAEKGVVIGVLPTFLASKENAHEGLAELHMVESMHERKLLMHQLSEGIITLPGGFGTFEELFEMLTWAQLGLHQFPMGLLNVNGYYDHLLAMIHHMKNEGLLRKANLELVIHDEDMAGLYQKMLDFKPIEGYIQMKKSQT
jgi:uncharacterized protein (TIGR00730 family)